jgi:hypothetical protein
MAKMTYDETLQALNDERCIESTNVQTRALRRKVWVSMNGMGGYMPNSRGVSRTKAQAEESCIDIAGDDAPRGFAAELRRTGSADSQGETYEVYPLTLAELF